MPPPAIRELADLCVVFEDTHASFLARLKKGVFALPKDGPEDALEDAADCGKNTGKQYHRTLLSQCTYAVHLQEGHEPLSL